MCCAPSDASSRSRASFAKFVKKTRPLPERRQQAPRLHALRIFLELWRTERLRSRAVRSAGLAGLVSAAGIAWSGVAGAQVPPRVTLRWNAPEACPDDAALLGAVESLLGRRLADAGAQQLSASIHVHGEPGAFSAKLVLTGVSGREERFLEHPECAKLADAVAVVIALAIDPEAVRARQNQLEQGAPTAPPSEPAGTGPAAAPSASPAARAPAPAAPPSGLSAGRPTNSVVMVVQGLLGAGVLPGVKPAFGAELGVRHRWFVAQASARFWASANAEVPNAAPASVELRLVSWGVRGCGLVPLHAWRIRPCLGADFGALSAIGENVSNSRARHDLLPALETSLAVAYAGWQPAPLGGLALTMPVSRPSFGVLENGVAREAFQPASIALVGFLGLAYGL